ncbi:hypothetical protein ACIB24_03950 [Spongisporangium articulatum]|uniref:DUF3887 domain-containing protein n=1 Tax=Spongisporangium articulatum TaxID=3362603 RepID=A0ABW8AIM5_9ACTN
MIGRAVLWVCRSPQRLAMVVVVVLAVVLLGGGALFGGGGDEGSDAATATRPASTAATVPDAGPYVGAAVTFVRAWAQVPAGRTAQQWRETLKPLVTDDLAKALATTDTSTLPGVQPSGEPVVRFVSQTSALIAVPLADGSSVLVTVVSDATSTKVSDVQPDVGD